MDQLSSCYFCGGALDVSLSEYPVVPTELRAEGEDSRTVVLCTTCRQKLATVVEEVVEATEGTVETDDEFGAADTASDDATGFDFVDSGDESTTDDSLVDNTDDAAIDDTDDADDSEGLLGSGSTDRTTTARDDSGTDESGADEPKASTGSTSAEGEEDDGPTLTKLEYNKVMRLLQNRELPVDRAEIRDVAINAYQISPEEFEAVIDAAVERDLIAERDGKFVSPE